jgi:hypothetical protein
MAGVLTGGMLACWRSGSLSHGACGTECGPPRMVGSRPRACEWVVRIIHRDEYGLSGSV